MHVGTSLSVAAILLLAVGGAGHAGSPAWIVVNEDESYTARHECSFVQAGDRFYLFGGRENARTLDTYDYASDSWTISARAPLEFNHFQATEYEGLIWVIGAFRTNNFPQEVPADAVWIFDPARDVWMEGPVIPTGRRRGSTGLVVHDDKFYVVGGNTIGHDGGYVPWFDEYDPRTGTWTPLTDAPGPRDHFHVALVGDRLYAVGGRLSGGPGGTFAPLVAEVDVYDFSVGRWTRLPPSSNLTTPRAAAAVALFGGEILLIGGEGDGNAYDTVEGFDPRTADWSPRASLNFARHGTQAIVSGQGIYITAGSPNQGGGNQRNMEVYHVHAPAGTAAVAGLLGAPAAVAVPSDSSATIRLSHVSGNEGAFVQSVALDGADASDFEILSDVGDPFLVAVSGFRDLTVAYHGSEEGASASLEVTYGGGELLTIALAGALDAGLPGSVSSLTLDRSGSGLELSWDADCGAGDTFGVYRGDLSLGYGSIEIESCDLTETVASVPIGIADTEFFLVVPSHGTTEGSFGVDGSCVERQPPLNACHESDSLDPCAAPCPGAGR